MPSTAGRPARSRHAAARGLVAAGILACTLAGTAPPAAADQPVRATATRGSEAAGARAVAPVPRRQYAVRIRLRSTTPLAPGPDGSVRMTGTITNTGRQPLYDLTASFWVDDHPLRTHAQLRSAAAERPGVRLGTRITEPYDLVDQVSGKLMRGDSAPFRVSVPVRMLDIAKPGVYVVGVDVRYTPPNPNGVPLSELRQTVGRVRTFLPQVPASAHTTPVDASFCVPLVAEPGLLSPRTVLGPTGGAFDESGRLSRLLDLGSRADVTWLVDPALLARARAVAAGARTVSGEAIPEGERHAARAWLDRADDVLQAGSTMLLPYGDPDLAALQHRNLTRSWPEAPKASRAAARAAGLDWVGERPETGGTPSPTPTTPTPTPITPTPTPSPTPSAHPTASTTTTHTPRTTARPRKGAGRDTPTTSTTPATPTASPSTTSATPGTGRPHGQPSSAPQGPEPGAAAAPTVVELPGRGYVDAATLESAAAAGLDTMVLSAAALPDQKSRRTTPVVTLTTPSGPVTALVARPSLTGRGAAGTSNRPGSGPGTRQRFLSETALMTLHGDPSQPPRVVATLPRNWTPSPADLAMFKTIAQVPWLQLVSAKALLADPPAPYDGQLDYPLSARRAQLAPTLLDELGQLSAVNQSYASMLVKPRAAQQRMDRTLLRGASTSWRGAPELGTDLVRAERAQVERAMTHVHVISPRFVTLSSSSGRFPVTVSNESSRSVRVFLQVEPRLPGRLEIEPMAPVVIAPRRKATVTVSARAPTGGVVVSVSVGLATPNHVSFGPTEDFTVRSTEYGVVGWVIMGVGLGLLFLASGLRVARRIRVRR